MGDDITIGVTEIVNTIEVTAQPNDQIVDISVLDNSDNVTLNVTPSVIEINVNKGSSYALWGGINGNITDQTDLQDALILKADLVDGKVPSYQLPSYVDDVIEVADYASLPVAGEIGKLYITLDNNKVYRWSGSVYVEIAANNAIWGAITGTLSSQTDLQNALNLKANDNAVVKLTGNQSVAGVKTFSDASNFDGNINLNKTTTLSVPTGYNTIGAYNTEFKFGIDSSRIAIVDLASLTAPRIYNYPDKDGIFAMTSDLHSAVTIGTANGLSLSSQELSLALSNATTTGALSSTDWSTFNNKQNALNGTGFVKISGTTISYDNSTYTPTSRTLTINGTSYDLSANRSWTIPTHDAVTIGTANGLSLSTQVLSLGLASGSANGALSSTDWTTFNGKLGGSFSSGGQIPVSTGSNNRFRASQLTEVSGSLHIGTINSSSAYEGITFTTSSPLSFGQFNFKNTNNAVYGNGTAIDLEGTYTTSFPNTTTAFARIVGKKSNTTNGNIDGDLLFFTRQNSESSVFSNAAAMIIKTDGKVGIGTTSPRTKIDIEAYTAFQSLSSAINSEAATDNQQIGGIDFRKHYGLAIGASIRQLQAGGVNNYSQAHLAFYTNNSEGVFGSLPPERMRITSSGNVVVNNLGTGLVYSNGGALTSTNPSDARLKDDITDLEYGLAEILQLRPVTYLWKNDTINQGKQFGFIAQEVEEIMPELVKEFETKDGEEDVIRLGLDKEAIFVSMVNAIKELQQQINELKNGN